MNVNERYIRQTTLSGFGERGQLKLKNAKVLVVGTGGLGCSALQYLVAAGIGSISIVDFDKIEISNLQRQVLFNTLELGLPKAEVAARKLRLLNPEIEIKEYIARVSNHNVVNLISNHDVVVDCSDNFETRFLLCDACKILDKPLVFGAIYRYEGQVAVFNVSDKNEVKTTYRHLFSSPPGPEEAPDCNTAGVLGVLPGIIGTMQATETIKLLSGVGEVLSNKLLVLSILSHQSFTMDIPPVISQTATYPDSIQALENFDYASHCKRNKSSDRGISPAELLHIIDNDDLLLIDVRNKHETPDMPFRHVRIPLHLLSDHIAIIDKKNVVVVCQSGQRSHTALLLLREKIGLSHTINHLEGGIIALNQYIDEN